MEAVCPSCGKKYKVADNSAGKRARCTNPNCGFNLKIRNGDVYVNEPVMSGSAHNSRVR